MDALLERVGHQAVNLALRSGIAITSSFAIQQCSRLLKTVDDKTAQAELRTLQKLLNSKIKIISPAIDLIEFKSGRGNVFLEGAVPLAKSLHREIVELGKRLESAATAEEASRQTSVKGKAKVANVGLSLIVADIKQLLARIDRDIPLIQLAITASGENLSTSLPVGISPSRLMQASTFLSFGDMQFASDPARPVQIGPSFTLSMYMLFVAHGTPHVATEDKQIARPSTPQQPLAGSPRPSSAAEEPYGIDDGDRKPIWQEVIHKARVRLCRTPLQWEFDRERGYIDKSDQEPVFNGVPANEADFDTFWRPDQYSYHLEIIEDLDDGRVHDEEDLDCAAFDDIPKAGIRESIPIHQIAKIFYTDTGRLLNIRSANGGENNPLLLLKRDSCAPTPSRLREQWGEVSDSPQPEDNDEGNELDEQNFIDRQLREESEGPHVPERPKDEGLAWQLPRHLDPEWVALEVYVEDNDEGSEDEDISTAEENSDRELEERLAVSKQRVPRNRSSVDSKLLAQIRNISLRSSPAARNTSQSPSGDIQKINMEGSESLVARSPFGSVTSSLSLMEMLVRLTSLQEFQQISHLSIPDHITTFFLEETSNTGLRGEARWRERNEAKRKVGFDPYTDTP